MPVVTVSSDDSGEPGFLLVDGRGDEMSEVCAFLRTLAVRRFSPNTIRAYAYDLQKLLSFLNDRSLRVDEFTPARAAEFLASLRMTTSVRPAQRDRPVGDWWGRAAAVAADLQPDPGRGLVVL